MNRLTKKIEEYKVYTLSNAYISEIPDMIYGKKYCGEAINKLGELEDIFELMEKMEKSTVCWRANDGTINKEYYGDCSILYNPKENSIEIYEYEFRDGYKMSEYGTFWWIEEEEK